ncbi:DUF397 domain-containing protein [Yinghuangia sp. YIM S09857]|uniref:DUF397 domain-containing protein n=1 Tax=Yinghuangia sp. YIM S09857 TaxID=3436929 RepID=UPI003F52AC6E
MTPLAPEQIAAAHWIKSTHSSGGGNECVEAAHFSAAVVGVRDSKDAASPVILVSGVAWVALTAGLTV